MSENKTDKVEIDIQNENEQVKAPEEAQEPVDETMAAPGNGAAAAATPDYYDQLLRVQAEFQNYKRRSEQRMQEWRIYAAKEIVAQLLPVVDDFEILFNHHQDKADSVCLDGVKMIYNKMMSTLKELGLEPLAAEGKEFDPNQHEAIMAEESDAVAEGHVLKVWQSGYLFKDSLLRPAKVITAKAKQDGRGDGE